MKGTEQSQEIDPHIYHEAIQWRKDSFFSTNSAGTVRYLGGKKTTKSLIYSSHPIQKLTENRS